MVRFKTTPKRRTKPMAITHPIASNKKGSYTVFDITHSSLHPPSKPTPKLFVKKLSEHAVTPTQSTSHAAGVDLHSAHPCIIPPGEHCLIGTDIAIALPAGTYGRIAPRSGLALAHGIDVFAGVVDRDYTGNVGVILANHGQEAFNISRGDRIAQLICEKCIIPDVEIVQSFNSVANNERGTKGFGSTGK